MFERSGSSMVCREGLWTSISKSLCEALRHPLTGHEDVASKIEKKYVIDYLNKEREGGE